MRLAFAHSASTLKIIVQSVYIFIKPWIYLKYPSIKNFVEGHLYIDEKTSPHPRKLTFLPLLGHLRIRIHEVQAQEMVFGNTSCRSSVRRSRWGMASMAAMMAASLWALSLRQAASSRLARLSTWSLSASARISNEGSVFRWKSRTNKK